MRLVKPRNRAQAPLRSFVALGVIAVAGCTCDDTLGVLNSSVTVDPMTLDFGRVPVDSQKTLKLTIGNRGSFIATVKDFAADAPFIAPTLTTTIATFREIEVDVALRPTEVGMVTGTLVFATDDPDAPEIMVPLIGEGIEAAVRVEPAIVDFGEILWNTQTQPMTVNVTVTNPGTDSFDLTNFTLVSDGAGAFSVDDMGIEQTFGPGASASFSVTYMPNAMGAVTGLVRFDTTTAAAPQIEVPLMGSAVGPELEICAAATGATELCTASGEVPAVMMLNVDRMGTADGTIRVINAGNRDLTFQSQFAQPQDEFTYAPDPTMAGQVVLTPNESREFDVTYMPADYEFDLQTVIFASNSATRPTASVLVRGEVGRPQLRVEPGTLTFQQNGAAPPATVRVALSNCGTLPLTLSGPIALRTIQGGNAFTLQNLPANGATLPMEDCNQPPTNMLRFDVTFDPPGDGVFRAEIDIPTNDPVTPTHTMAISGTRS